MKVRLLRFLYLRGTETDAGKSRYIADALDYVDDLFVQAQPYLLALPEVPSREEALQRLARTRDAAPDSKYARWEYEYRLKAYGIPGTPTRKRLAGLD
jgi:hypothetical protein